MEARLQAFGSERVFSAVQGSSTADRDVTAAYDSWRAAVAKPGTSPADLEKARRTADVARKAADDADDAVIEQVRRELDSKGGKPLDNWEYFPMRRASTTPARPSIHPHNGAVRSVSVPADVDQQRQTTRTNE